MLRKRILLKALLALTVPFGNVALATSIHGLIDLRPTWTFSTGKLDTRGTFGLHTPISETVRIYYSQGINFDLKNSGAFAGKRVVVVDAFLGLDVGNYPLDQQSTLNLSFHPSILLPTDSLARSNGLIAGVRHALALEKSLGGLVLGASLNQALFAYKQAGGKDAKGNPVANPVFENGVELIARIPLFTDVRFDLAAKFYQLRYASYMTGARHDDEWVFRIARATEIFYTVSPSITLGISFQTGNFTEEDLTEFSVGQAWSKGIVQFIFILNL